MEELTIKLKDHIDFPAYSWPPTLLRYPTSRRDIKVAEYELIDMATGEAVPWQLCGRGDSRAGSDKDGRGDGTKGAPQSEICFITDLPSGGEREFLLRRRSKSAQPTIEPGVTVSTDQDCYIIDNGRMKVKLPRGGENSRGGKHKIPAPIVSIGRGDRWIGYNYLDPGSRKLTCITTELVEEGPLVVAGRVVYEFEPGGRFEAVVTMVKNYPFIDYFEKIEGIEESDGIFVYMNWKDFHPRWRFGMGGEAANSPADYIPIDKPLKISYSKEDPHWYNSGIEDPATEMYFRLTSYMGNGPKDMMTRLCFREDAGDELGVFTLDSAYWEDYQYGIWQNTQTLQVRFSFAEGLLCWKWPIIRGSRSTGIHHNGIEDGEKTVDKLKKSYKTGLSGPFCEGLVGVDLDNWPICHSQYLRSFYGVLSLNKVKDWILEYPADGKILPDIFERGIIQSADELEDRLFRSTSVQYPIGINTKPGVESISHRYIYHWLIDGYVRFRKDFSEPQRKRINALLLLGAYVCTCEEMHPKRRAISAAPNIVADGYSVPAQMAALFPEHPAAPEWLDYFEKVWKLDALFFARPDVEKYQSLGGRWTESLGVYNWAQLHPTVVAYYVSHLNDGVNRWANKHTALRARWMLDMQTAPLALPEPDAFRQSVFDGTAYSPPPPDAESSRQFPSYGSHGSGTSQIRYHQYLDFFIHALRYFDPLVAEHLLWLKRPLLDHAGKEHEANWNRLFRNYMGDLADNPGTDPHLKSCKYTGHGIVLRAGVGTDDELSIHLNQVDRGPNYRWGWSGENGSGSLYFFAAGKTYTGHDYEALGDRECDDTDGYTTFGYMKDGQFKSIGMNVLEKPLYDFEGAQYCEIVPRKGRGAYSWPEYKSRNILLAGTDYFILTDECGTIGRNGARFTWFTSKADPFPEIHYLKPLAIHYRGMYSIENAFARGIFREVRGCHIALITHKKDVRIKGLTREALPGFDHPALLNSTWSGEVEGMYEITSPRYRDVLFRNDLDINVDTPAICFSGQAGIVRYPVDGGREMALFKGTMIGDDSVTLKVSRSGIGVSLLTRKTGQGREAFCGDILCPFSEGGNLTLTNHSTEEGTWKFYLDGDAVASTESKNGSIALTVPVRQGRFRWEFSPVKPRPLAPEILYTVNGPDGAEVFFSIIEGAEEYLIEVSRNGGENRENVGKSKTDSFQLKGLANGIKIHVRVSGVNSDCIGEPSAEYPVYISGDRPHCPEGVNIRSFKDKVVFEWGEVLGVHTYKVYRKSPGESEFTLIHQGPDLQFTDESAHGAAAHNDLPGGSQAAVDEFYQYYVTAENNNGESASSRILTADPASWLNWYPPVPLKFKRDSEYVKFPYVRREETPPRYYAE